MVGDRPQAKRRRDPLQTPVHVGPPSASAAALPCETAREEKLQRPAPEPPTDPRMFVIPTLVGFHCCDRRADEHPLQAYSAAAKGAAGEAGMQALLDGFFAAHRVNLDAEPTPDALRAMQRLLDGVPERWRDAEVGWWPVSE
jgi:hypothetical protein